MPDCGPGRDGGLRFRVLGPLEVWTGQDWSGIGAPKWRALLAVLLLGSGQVVPTDRLAAELWGDEPPDRAANLISVYVLRLRRLIGDPDGRTLITRSPGYQLRLGPDDLDAQRFEALTAQGREQLAEGNAELASGVLAEALELWRGGALADVPPSPLVSAETDRLEESRLAALEMRIEADLGIGLHAQVVPELRRLITDHSLREGLWCLLMRALDGAGRHAEAIAAYGQAREIIADELGVDPSPELQALYQRMLSAGNPAARRASSAAAPPAAAAPGTASAALSAAQWGAQPGQPPAQLPADVADFTGRDEHVRQLSGLLNAARRADIPAVAVAVVAGAGGVGKTALAVHAAHALSPGFPDGQLYVSLLGAGQHPVPPEEVLARFLRDLGVPATQIPVNHEERAALYRTRLAGRRMLIVLDDARDAAQVRSLLPGSSSCAVIVTSRQRLSDLAGSQLLDLDVLDRDEAGRLFARIIGAERADAEPGPVHEVLAACAGLPLAIRIAGARLAARRNWTVRTLADRLGDQGRRIDELTAGDLAVRACFQVSFDALRRSESAGSDPARVFRLLGIWLGPSIALPAAAALTNEPQDAVADVLEVLVDAHLLESPAPDRYRLHDLLRVYAAEQAHADENPQAVQDAIRRIAGWYLRTADAAAGVVAPYRDRVPPEAESGSEPLTFDSAEQALHWCEVERANIVAATRQAAACGLHDIAWKLPVAAVVCFERLGYRWEWLTAHRIALDSVREVDDKRGEAQVLNNLGMVLGQQQSADAPGYFEQALTLYRAAGDRQGQARAANNLAFSYRFLGRHEEEVAALLSALELQRQIGRRSGEGVALCNLGEAYLELGRHQEAISCSQDALIVVREIGSARDEGYALYNLGRANLELNRAAEAADLLKQALAVHRVAGDRYGEAQDLYKLGLAYARTRRLAQARECWMFARALFESLGDDSQAAELRSQLAGLDPLLAET
jgi:DNA-binding SARP family transcriptional activator